MTPTPSDQARPDSRVALGYGLTVFPMPPGRKRPEPGWRNTIITTPAAVQAWPAGANVGIACRASGVVGLDLDMYPGQPSGIATLAWLADQHDQPWPDTLAVATPSGGRHLYFRTPDHSTILSSSGRIPGIDIRGPGRRTGGYLAGPTSVVNGAHYSIDNDAPIAELPCWLADLLVTPKNPDPLSRSTSGWRRDR